MNTTNAAAAQPAAHGASSTKRPPWAPGGGLRILLVDSEWAAADQLAGALQLHGHQVRLAHRGVEALVVAEELQPHIALIETGRATGRSCPTSVLLRCRPWAERLVLIGHTRYGRAGRRHCELLHYEFPDAIDVGQLMPIYENLLRMRGASYPSATSTAAASSATQPQC